MKSICVIHSSSLETCFGGKQSLYGFCLHEILYFHMAEGWIRRLWNLRKSRVQVLSVRESPKAASLMLLSNAGTKTAESGARSLTQSYKSVSIWSWSKTCPAQAAMWSAVLECLSLPSIFEPCANRLEILAVSPVLQICLSWGPYILRSKLRWTCLSLPSHRLQFYEEGATLLLRGGTPWQIRIPSWLYSRSYNESWSVVSAVEIQILIPIASCQSWEEKLSLEILLLLLRILSSA